MKIAVCLSGQPRSIEYCIPAIKYYFGNESHTFDFFCHAWNYNTWKLIEDRHVKHTDIELVDQNWLEDQIKRLSPVEFKIDSRRVIYLNPQYRKNAWSSLFYSAMIANHLKKMHEFKNNFRYDCVVRARYDLIFSPEHRFKPLEILDRTLYHPHLDRMKYEHNFINASDPFFYGDSWGMDIASDVFRNIIRDLPNSTRWDNFFNLGPGALISKYCKERNVQHLLDKVNSSEIIYRREMLGKDPVSDFKEIMRYHRSYYE